MEINKDTIQPVKNYLLIEVDVEKETSSGLLLAEDGGYTLPTVGTVIRSGELAEYKEGEVVIFRKYSADEIKVTTAEKEEKYWLLESSEVIGLISSENPEIDRYEQIKERKGIVEPERIKGDKE